MFVEHGTLFLTFNDLVIHVDPVGRYADYSTMPDADMTLITHHHGDHFDPSAIEKISMDSTLILCSSSCKERLETCQVMKNSKKVVAHGIVIKAVPAYNPRRHFGFCNGNVDLPLIEKRSAYRYS